MILLPVSRPVFIALDPVHLRSSFDILFAIARDQLGLDAMLAAIVIFFNRDRSRCKILFHDGRGFVILYKRLDKGRFHIPSALTPTDRSVRIEPRELAILLSGVAKNSFARGNFLPLATFHIAWTRPTKTRRSSTSWGTSRPRRL